VEEQNIQFRNPIIAKGRQLWATRRVDIMAKSFTYTFEDESAENTLTFECSDSEHLKLNVEDGVAVLYATKAALNTLARIFAKMSMSDYKDGFHLHVNEDFDSERPEALRVVIDEEL